MKKSIFRVWILLLALIAMTSLPLSARAENETGEVSHYLSGNNGAAGFLGLSETEYKSLCYRIDSAIQNEQDSLLLSGFTFSASLLEIEEGRAFVSAFSDIVRSDALHYYASLDSISYHSINQLLTVTLNLKYMDSGKRAEIEAAAGQILSGIADSSLSDAEKALLVHDRLAVWCEYDSVSFASGNIPDDSYSIYGTMAKRISVCQGYAESYGYLMCRLGIPTRVVSSDKANHAWNIVTIGGKDYHVDVTFDDPTQDTVGRVTHDYFLISTNRLKELDPGRRNADDFDFSPVSTNYEDGIWTNSDTAFTLLNGKLYYIDNRDDGNRDASRRKGVYEWNGGNPRQILAFADYPGDNVWLTESGAYYLDSYARLSTDGRYLYFNLTKNVYRLTPGQTAQIVWTPAETVPDGINIIGFREEDGWFVIRIGDTPNVPANPPASSLIRYQYPVIPETPVLTGISVVSGPAKTEFAIGEAPDFSGLVIRKTYSDGTTENVTAGFTFSDVDTSSAGQKTVTVSLDGKQTTFTITVKQSPAFLTGISVASGPAKTVYYIGEFFDPTGLKIKLLMSDGTEKTIENGFEVSGFEANQAGERTLTVEYGGKTVSFRVTVKTPSVRLSETLRTLEKGESFVLRAALTPEEGSVTWTSSVPSVASVGTDGTVTALKKGTADITALFRFGGISYRAVCRVNVTDAEAETDPSETGTPETDPPETGSTAEKEVQAFIELVDGFGSVTEENYLKKIGDYNEIGKAKEKLSSAARALIPDSVNEKIAGYKQALDEIAEKISGRVTDAPDTGAQDTGIETRISETEPVPTDAPVTDNDVTDPEKNEEEDEDKSLKTLLLVIAVILVLLLLVLLFAKPGEKKKTSRKAPKKKEK